LPGFGRNGLAFVAWVSSSEWQSLPTSELPIAVVLVGAVSGIVAGLIMGQRPEQAWYEFCETATVQRPEADSMEQERQDD